MSRRFKHSRRPPGSGVAGRIAPAHPGRRARRIALASSLVLAVGLLSAAGWFFFLDREAGSQVSRGEPRVRGMDGPPLRIDAEPVVVALPSRARGGATAIETLAEKQDARRDQWGTEVLTEQVLERLDVLRDALSNGLGRPGIDREVGRLVADGFAATPLRPSGLGEAYRDDRILVRRHSTSSPPKRGEHRGAAGLLAALEKLRSPLGAGQTCRVHFKLYRVHQEADSFTTLLRYEGSSVGLSHSVEQLAVWLCRWTYPVDGDLRLLRLDLQSYEEAEADVAGGTLFVDCTVSALGSTGSYGEQILPGINHWLARVPREFMSQFGHNGLALGDVNGDRLEDIYICDSGGLPNRLYLQQEDGTARDVSAAAGVDFLDDSSGALLVDLDNDGDQDLVVAADPLVQIAENDGRGRFQLRGPIPLNTDALSLSAADFDGDGDLDIHVCGYNVRQKEPTNRGLPFPLPYHDARNGGRNILLRNEGGLHFVDATAVAGLEAGNSRFSMAASWEDFDNDGDQDLYVANDFGPNNLFRNDGGRFTDVALAAGARDHAAGMSVSWGDYNRDGRMDLYIGNMFSAAGNRVAHQHRFQVGKAPKTVGLLRRMARGNTLLANVDSQGYVAFRDVSMEQAVEMGRWAWSSSFLDLTNDGWQDLVVANGYVTGSNPDDL
jgi:hypothetical protein